jgi:hypothetical protein
MQFIFLITNGLFQRENYIIKKKMDELAVWSESPYMKVFKMVLVDFLWCTKVELKYIYPFLLQSVITNFPHSFGFD